MLTLDDKKQTFAELEQFSKLKVELDKLGIPTDNIRLTIGIIQGVRQSGYKVETITQLLSAWEASTAIQAQLEKKIDSLTVYNAELQEKNDILWDQLWTNRGKLSLCEDLRNMGFGIKELKLLSGLIKEVAAANNIAPDIAVKRFFEDIEKDYDNKLGYESKLVHLKSDIVKTNYELIAVQKSLASKQQVAVALSELSLFGFNDQEIFNLALALQSNVSNKESLEADLNKYGSLKRLIQELTEELRILESTAMESIGFTCRLNMRIDNCYSWISL
jgi:DNA-binding transcriptional MerR regulator